MRRIGIAAIALSVAGGAGYWYYKGGDLGSVPLGRLFADNPAGRWESRMQSAASSMEQSNWQAALEDLEPALVAAKRLPDDPRKSAVTLERMADCELRLAKPKPADEHVAEALKILDANKPKDPSKDPDYNTLLARVLLTTGRAKTYTGGLAEAEDALRRVTALVKDLDAKRPEHFEVQFHLGRVYYEMGRPRKSIEALKAAMVAEKKRLELGAESENLASALTEMGRAYLTLADFEQASNHFDRANRIHKGRRLVSTEKNVEPTTASEAWTSVNVALLLMQRGDSLRVESIMASALHTFDDKLPKPSREGIVAQREYGVALLDKRKFREAETNLRFALSASQQLFGKNHPELGRSLSAYAQFLEATNRVEDAAEHFKRAKDIEDSLATFRETVKATAADVPAPR